MKVDEVIKSAVSRAGVIRVQNALNPLLWVLSISTPSCWIAAYMFRDDAVLKYSFSALGALPILGSIIAYFLFFCLDRDRLQSEEFILKQHALQILYRKGDAAAEIVEVANDMPRLRIEKQAQEEDR